MKTIKPKAYANKGTHHHFPAAPAGHPFPTWADPVPRLSTTDKIGATAIVITYPLKTDPYSPVMKEFFDNVLRYPRYMIALILGIFIALFDRIRPMIKNRTAAAAFVGFLVSAIAFVFFTLRAMLGLTPA